MYAQDPPQEWLQKEAFQVRQKPQTQGQERILGSCIAMVGLKSALYSPYMVSGLNGRSLDFGLLTIIHT